MEEKQDKMHENDAMEATYLFLVIIWVSGISNG